MEIREHPRTDLYRAEREKGLTYQQIADKHGVSRQCVAQACGRQKTYYYRYNICCVYPVLRQWLNDNKISTRELLNRMGLTSCPKNYDSIGDKLRGDTELKKSDIDKLIQITGITYEKLFKEDKDGEE